MIWLWISSFYSPPGPGRSVIRDKLTTPQRTAFWTLRPLRAGRVGSGARFGLSLAIDWPLWQAGGMRERAAQDALADASGMVAMDTRQGLTAFYQAVTLGIPQLGVVAEITTRYARLS